MRIVTRTSSSDEHDNGDVETAYILLDEALAKVIAGRLNLFDANKKSHPGLVEMHFLSDTTECGFFGYLAFHDYEKGFLPGEEVEKKLDDNGWAEIPDDNPFKGDLSRDSFDEVFAVPDEGVYMITCERGVYWEAHLKYTSIRVFSELLPREVLSRVI